MEYYSSLKKNEIPTCITTCMNPEDITVSEMSQDNYCIIPLI